MKQVRGVLENCFGGCYARRIGDRDVSPRPGREIHHREAPNSVRTMNILRPGKSLGEDVDLCVAGDKNIAVELHFGIDSEGMAGPSHGEEGWLIHVAKNLSYDLGGNICNFPS